MLVTPIAALVAVGTPMIDPVEIGAPATELVLDGTPSIGITPTTCICFFFIS